MMRSYARRGAGTVYWLLLPTPRSPRFQAVFGPVNQALRTAAQSFPGTARVIDLGATFTPHGRFRARMRWQGKSEPCGRPTACIFRWQARRSPPS